MPKGSRKTEQVLRRIQSTVLASALPDSIHIKKAFVYNAIEIVKLVQDQTAITAILVLLERNKTALVQ